MQVILAKCLEVCQPSIIAVNRLREGSLDVKDGIPLLDGKLPKLRNGKSPFGIDDWASCVTHWAIEPRFRVRSTSQLPTARFTAEKDPPAPCETRRFARWPRSDPGKTAAACIFDRNECGASIDRRHKPAQMRPVGRA
jgi:hypothetical protein